MIAQKKKNKIIELYMLESDELESFTLLRLSTDELLQLKECSNSWEIKENTLISKYETNDKLDSMFKKLAVEHQKINPQFKDVSKTFKSKVSGTSMLIRDPRTKIIRIALRHSNDDCTINKIYIDNNRRELFFNDSKRSTYYNQTGKYGISYEDKQLYNYWSTFMTEQYFLELKEESK